MLEDQHFSASVIYIFDYNFPRDSGLDSRRDSRSKCTPQPSLFHPSWAVSFNSGHVSCAQPIIEVYAKDAFDMRVVFPTRRLARTACYWTCDIGRSDSQLGGVASRRIQTGGNGGP
jgi:hypothetical protein